MATVRCPACGDELEVLDAHRDWTVRCPHCDGEFVPSEARAPRPSRPARRRRPDPDDEDDYVDYERDAQARRTVAAPAMWLEVLGWLGALASVGVIALCVVGAAFVADNGGNDEDAVPLLMLGGCTGVFGVPYSIVMAIGARRMRDLSSRGWAMTACMLAIGSFSVCGVVGIIHAGFGVWALIALDKPEVRAAFGLTARNRDRDRRRNDW